MVWFGLYSSTSFRFLTSVCKIEGGGDVRTECVYVFVHNVYICVHVCFYISVRVNDFGSFHSDAHPHSSMAFLRLSSMSRSAVAGAHMGSHSHVGERMWFWTDVPAVYKSNNVIPPPLICPHFFFKQPKNKLHWFAFWELLSDDQNSQCHLSLLAPFLSFPSLFLSSFSMFGTPPLCDFRKAQRYPTDCFYMLANGLFWMVLNLNALTGSCNVDF